MTEERPGATLILPAQGAPHSGRARALKLLGQPVSAQAALEAAEGGGLRWGGETGAAGA